LEVQAAQKERAIAHFSDGKLKTFMDWPVTRRENMDGIKVYLGEVGWVMVRASGTENVLRVYAETAKMETTRRVLGAVSQVVERL
jgi:phosphomannomutase